MTTPTMRFAEERFENHDSFIGSIQDLADTYCETRVPVETNFYSPVSMSTGTEWYPSRKAIEQELIWSGNADECPELFHSQVEEIFSVIRGTKLG